MTSRGRLLPGRFRALHPSPLLSLFIEAPDPAQAPNIGIFNYLPILQICHSYEANYFANFTDMHTKSASQHGENT